MLVIWWVFNSPFFPSCHSYQNSIIRKSLLLTIHHSSSAELLQAKFPAEGSSSLLPGIAFFCQEIIHLLLSLPQFFLFLEMQMKTLPSHEASPDTYFKIVSASRKETTSHSTSSPGCLLQSLAHGSC